MRITYSLCNADWFKLHRFLSGNNASLIKIVKLIKYKACVDWVEEYSLLPAGEANAHMGYAALTHPTFDASLTREVLAGKEF